MKTKIVSGLALASGLALCVVATAHAADDGVEALTKAAIEAQGVTEVVPEDLSEEEPTYVMRRKHFREAKTGNLDKLRNEQKARVVF